MDFDGLKYIVVGAGFFGAVIAERIANDLKEKVLVVDSRKHIGGNCYSEDDGETGIHYHTYGTHIFHTSKKTVWDYLTQFTEINGYFHQVLTTYKDRVYQMPINLETINSFYNINLKPYEVEDFLRREIQKEQIETPGNFEEKAIAMIGRPLYEAFIKEYTMKQWHKDPKQLPESILSRLPFRTNYNESYYFDRWQGVPLNGYTEIFQNMLKNERITLQLNTDYFAMKDRIPESTTIIYSGPIDKFFDYKYGRLEWLTLDFEKKIVNVEDYQGNSVMNYAERSVPYTRIHEPRHLHPERTYSRDKTMIIKEYSVKKGENNPYYPITDPRNTEILSCYLQEKKKTNVVIGGRLGDYKYYDMDQTIETALSVYKHVIRTAS
ncbi:UDP-galactopyranose mutase [Candidatus Electrothrix aarhusensis]|uniref:UDP-galactopyranose mutase n=1 Tax=Candidatus Electrothrix aarhusensis TaxID=1859131 RepID=A0A3S3RSD5_9BACT|nr:UDP-galactopyranose mutase [Candidatus Electrothrix aarhusensis]